MAHKKKPIYTLRNGIRVIHENFSGRYVMVRIEANLKLFPNSAITPAGRQYVQRARVIMTAKLGRALRTDEHVHHKNEKRRHDDSLRNLELKGAFAHNSEHHRGMKHSADAKRRISATLRATYADGRRKRPNLRGRKNPFFGRKHTEAAKLKMRKSRRAA